MAGDKAISLFPQQKPCFFQDFAWKKENIECRIPNFKL